MITSLGINLYLDPDTRACAQSVERQGKAQHTHKHEHDDSERAPRARGQSPDISALFTIDNKILTISRQIRETRDKLNELNIKNTRYQAEIKSLDRLLNVDSVALMKLLTLRERVRPARVIELLLSSDGPLEQKRREVYLSALFKSGTHKLRVLSLAKRKLSARRRASRLLTQRAQDLERLLQERSTQLTHERHREWEAIANHHTQTATRAISSDQEQEESRWENANRLPPAQGRWIDEFRSFRGRALAKLYGSGVWILSDAGAPIYCVESGRVLFSGQVKGWGGVVIVQHSFEYMSIYGNLSRRAVRRGAQVKMQARLGDSGDEAGRSGLYFELRRGGEPVHPERFINPQLTQSLSISPLRSP